MEQHIIDTIRALRSGLHNLAERSWEEKRTKACLMEFLREKTSLRLEDEGQWFCAVHEEPEDFETIAFGFAAARFIAAMPELANRFRFHGLTMATLIGAKIGTKAFGSAAGSAEVWLTLRAWHEDDLNLLLPSVEETAFAEAYRDGVNVSFSSCDIFPSTVNDPATLERLWSICQEVGLDCIELSEPFRWSEDFGYYGSGAKAVMVGIGAGLDWPQLHTENYIFNDNILPVALRLFSALARFG